MRTRLFVDQNREVVDTLIDNVMNRKAEDKDASLHLSIHSENRHHYNQSIKENELASVDFNRIVVINNNTAALIREVFDRGASVRVITTNNLENALGAINNSSYSYLNHRRTISASRLKINGEKFGSKMDGMPIFGPRKVDIAREIENAKKRIFKVALGDSFTNDGPMMRYALNNGGVAVIVSDDYEKARAKFNPIYEELGENGIGDRMWYVDSSKLEDN